VLSVVAYHAGLPFFGGGYLGVDVFFVISGYLIGGQLVRELSSTGRIDLAGFYARRARRILPASLTVIALTMIAMLFLAPPLRGPGIAIDAIWSDLSAANMRFAIQGTDYLAAVTPSPLQHYWSLGVEEQFYVVVPLVLLALFFALRTRPRALLAVGALLTAASFILCLSWGSASPWTYFALPARAWELGIGVFAAVASNQAARLTSTARQVVAGVGLLCLIVTGWIAPFDWFVHPGIGTVLPVLATAAVILGGESATGAVDPLVTKALGVRPMQFIGTLSFSLYLVHWPMLELAQENSNSELPLPLGIRIVIVLLSFPVALLLWRFVETPFLRRTSRDSTRRPLIAACAAIVALVLVSSAAVPALAARPMTSDRPASSGVKPLPAGTPFVPSNLQPRLGLAANDTGALYSDGCQQGTSGSELKVCSFGPTDGATVVLFGDSHAGRWFPAIRAAFAGKPVRLVTLTKSGCRSLESARLWSGAENHSCAAWRASAVEWIGANHPQLLILANHLGRSAEPAEVTETQWRNATISTLARFPKDVRVAILAETPEFDFSPPVCLSRHLDDALSCAESRTDAVNGAVIAGARSGARAAGGTFVDLTDWFCNALTCPTIIGSALAYTDEHHMSATFSSQLGGAVYGVLAPLLAR
jgi:peptidoglycan/LPS O-acetylase OafA/YrhL